MSFEDIDVTTKEGQYLVAAVELLFRSSPSIMNFDDIMAQIKKELEYLKNKYPERFGEKVAVRTTCIGCGLGIGSDNSLGLCSSCQWDSLSGYNGGAQC